MARGVELWGGLNARVAGNGKSPRLAIEAAKQRVPSGAGLTAWRADQIAMAVLTAALLAVVMVTYASYGFTTDEARGFERASRVYAFLSSAGNDNRIAEFSVANYYGSAPDVLALLLQSSSPFSPTMPGTSSSLCLGWSGFSMSQIGSTFVSPWTGGFAALFLATTPMWFGYMFINHKDIPFAAMLIASSYYSLVTLTASETPAFVAETRSDDRPARNDKNNRIPNSRLVVVVFLGCFMLFPSDHKVALNRAFVHRAAAMSAAALGGILVAPYYLPRLYLFRPDQVFRVVTTFLNFEKWRGTALIFQTAYKADKIPGTTRR